MATARGQDDAAAEGLQVADGLAVLRADLLVTPHEGVVDVDGGKSVGEGFWGHVGGSFRVL